LSRPCSVKKKGNCCEIQRIENQIADDECFICVYKLIRKKIMVSLKESNGLFFFFFFFCGVR
jgi:hypothetical protein